MQLTNPLAAFLALFLSVAAKPVEGDRGHVEELRPETHHSKHPAEDKDGHDFRNEVLYAREIPDENFPTVLVDRDGNEYTDDNRFDNVKLSHPHARIFIDKRAQQTWYGVYECNKPEFKGECHWRLAVPVGQHHGGCINRLFTDNENVSMGIDKGLLCSLWEEQNCKGHMAYENYQYAFNWKTSDFWEDWHDPQSYNCSVITFGDTFVIPPQINQGNGKGH